MSILFRYVILIFDYTFIEKIAKKEHLNFTAS